MSVKDWWDNTNYDREHMTAFYEEHPDWSDLPPEAVAKSTAFQVFAVGEAFRHLWKTIKEIFDA